MAEPVLIGDLIAEILESLKPEPEEREEAQTPC